MTGKKMDNYDVRATATAEKLCETTTLQVSLQVLPLSKQASPLPLHPIGQAALPPPPHIEAVTQVPQGSHGITSRRVLSDVLRTQQQRLVLLRHASKCISKPSECLVTPHCEQVKLLWRHIVICKDPGCNVPHCVSSRLVLSHYHRCRDQNCDVCEPVRTIIKADSSNSDAFVVGVYGSNGILPSEPSSHSPADSNPVNYSSGSTEISNGNNSPFKVPQLLPQLSAAPFPKEVILPNRSEKIWWKDIVPSHITHWKVITVLLIIGACIWINGFWN
jgi:hypothetical protein